MADGAVGLADILQHWPTDRRTLYNTVLQQSSPLFPVPFFHRQRTISSAPIIIVLIVSESKYKLVRTFSCCSYSRAKRFVSPIAWNFASKTPKKPSRKAKTHRVAVHVCVWYSWVENHRQSELPPGCAAPLSLSRSLAFIIFFLVPPLLPPLLLFCFLCSSSVVQFGCCYCVVHSGVLKTF